jgi:hypothetical protein
VSFTRECDAATSDMMESVRPFTTVVVRLFELVLAVGEMSTWQPVDAARSASTAIEGFVMSRF